MTTKHRVLALTLGTFICMTAGPALASPDCTGTYAAEYGAVGGRGAGTGTMTITQKGSSLVWNTGAGYTYICALRGTKCSGTWSGKTGSGWFAVSFTGNGNSFSGSWGYGDDHSDQGSFTGTRQ